MSEFDRIADKVRAGERLDAADGMALYMEPDVLKLGMLANDVRERLHGDRTFFNVNMRFEATNVCQATCSFCAFSKLKDGDAGAHTTTHEAAWKELADNPDPRLTELHMVNGLHPGHDFCGKHLPFHAGCTQCILEWLGQAIDPLGDHRLDTRRQYLPV